jgi:hypothetical protein
MSKTLDPMATPQSWRIFLYEEVLIPWETKALHCRTEVYSKAAIDSGLQLHVLKKNKVDELQAVEAELKKHPGEYLAFYCDGKGYEALFKRLRDCVAHAHYAQNQRGWITLAHRFQGRGERKPKLRLVGHLKMATLKRLVAFINIGGSA